MKPFLKIAGLVVAGLVIVVLLFSGLIIKGAVNRAGPRLLGVPVQVQSVKLSLLRGHMTLRGLHVGNPAGYKTASLFDLRTLEVDLDVLSLLKKTVIIREIRIEAPEITYERGLKNSNIGALQAQLNPPGAAATPAAAPPAVQDKTGGKKVIIKKLTITGAKVKASITMLGGQTLSLPLPPITLHDIGGGEENKQGVAFATAINDILNAILAGVSQVITGVGGVAADGVKAAGDGLNKLGDGLGKALGGAAGLFKKNAEPPPQK